MIASGYATPERVDIAKASADAIRSYLVDAKSKSAIDFGCGTGLVGLHMINQIEQKITDFKIQNVETLCFDIEQGIDFIQKSWLRL